MDEILSQEEINALLNGLGSEEKDLTEEDLTEEEKDAIGEISNISMGSAATTLFTLVNQKVVITAPEVEIATWDDVVSSYDMPCVFLQIYYKEGLDGNNILILKDSDVKIITDLMMGGDGTNTSGDLTDLHLSAISEAMNQMMGTAATSVSTMLDKMVNISPPEATVLDLKNEKSVKIAEIADFLSDRFVKVSFSMVIGDLVDSRLMQLYPIDFAKDLYMEFISAKDDDYEEEIEEEIKEEPAQKEAVQAQPYMVNQEQEGQMIDNMLEPVQDLNIQPVQFAPFVQGSKTSQQVENIDLLMDVPLEVTVELGRTSKTIKEILEFTPGTIIELNRLAGEPIDVLVNGKFVAKGEVVVMEEAFGIRVTEITHENMN